MTFFKLENTIIKHFEETPFSYSSKLIEELKKKGYEISFEFWGELRMGAPIIGKLTVNGCDHMNIAGPFLSDLELGLITCNHINNIPELLIIDLKTGIPLPHREKGIFIPVKFENGFVMVKKITTDPPLELKIHLPESFL
jgi:hypothetical protein